MNAFSSYALDKTPHDIDPQFPTQLIGWKGAPAFAFGGESTVYGYVHTGVLRVHPKHLVAFDLMAGMYFSLPAPVILGGINQRKSSGVLLVRVGYRGVLHLGGPIEPKGRLRYIDGCTDSLLIPPQRRGEPCLNLLHFPPGIDQTAHTHPSARGGMIVSGKGRCIADGEATDLIPGMTWCIHPGGVHKFQTPYGEDMRVIAFHPDSDFGPTDEDHPMLNRTIVGEESARNLPNIRTGRDVAVEYEHAR